MDVKMNTLTQPEWAMMSALWGKEPQVLSEIIRSMEGKVNWSYQTYSTYIKLLCDKGYVGSTLRGRTRLYRALIEKDACIEAEKRSIRQKLDEQSAQKLLVCMLRDTKLSEEGRKKLEDVILELEQGEIE